MVRHEQAKVMKTSISGDKAESVTRLGRSRNGEAFEKSKPLKNKCILSERDRFVVVEHHYEGICSWYCGWSESTAAHAQRPCCRKIAPERPQHTKRQTDFKERVEL